MREQPAIQIALYAAITAALGLLPPVPFAFGVPITAQSLGVMLAGVMLGPWRGALSMLLFCFVTALGVPLLSGGRGGLGVLASPTAGFFIGFPVAALATGLLVQATRRLGPVPSSAVAALFGGIGALYVCGITGFKLVTGTDWPSSTVTMAAFIPGDLVKVVITVLVAKSVERALPGTTYLARAAG